VVFCEDAWILDIMLHSVLASVDAELYEKFYLLQLNTGSDAGEAFLRTGFERYLEILSYGSPADATTSDKSCWINASEAIYDETAGMFFHPDWVKGYLSSLGFSAGIDFDSVPVFGTEDVFRFNVDSFVMFKDALNVNNGVNFLSAVGSPEGQVAFNTIKGSSPVNSNIDRESSLWDSVSESTLNHFDGATYRLWDLDYYNEPLGDIGSRLYRGILTVDQAVAKF
jgi:glucose/mannose transport system substrate-binding protein